MILNQEIHINNINPKAKNLVFIHGLFGSLSNLGMLARAFLDTHNVIQIDVRNHGKSDHSDDINYDLMAQDIVETLDHLNIQNFSVVGHSMGGKIAMKLADIAQNRIDQMVILDIAPFAYQENHHDSIFRALFAVQNANVATRAEAIEIMRQHLKEDMVIQFLLKSFSKGQWMFNVNAIYEHYSDILSWENITSGIPALFIRGGSSPYIKKDIHLDAIRIQFPNAQVETVDGAGHWLHAEKTSEVLSLLNKYLNS